VKGRRVARAIDRACVGRIVVIAGLAASVGASCAGRAPDNHGRAPISEPIVTHIYTADPAAHVFGDRIYIFVSHDVDTGAGETPDGDQFDMRDYRVLSMDTIGGPVVDHGVIIDKRDIPWAQRQLWAPDVAFHNGTYFLYFPAKDESGVFRIGVARGAAPTGPYVAERRPIEGSFSIDPAVFKDDDGTFYMYFGGIWGGQLQRWQSGRYDPSAGQRDGERPALGPRIARLRDDMLAFRENVKEVSILDEHGRPLREEHRDRRFFEAAWMHKFKGTYYLSYSTGDTHFICYATGESPYGPFIYRGVILQPVVGWTNHHSIVEFRGRWYLFFHDSELSGGKAHLRNVKVTELSHNDDGTIQVIDAYR